MSKTQITYPVWNSQRNLSWIDQQQIARLPRFISEFLLDRFGSPFLLFHIRHDIINILKHLPASVITQPLIEIDICLSVAAASYLEAITGKDVYNIGRWLTNQFSSARFHENIGKKIPNTVVHLWQENDDERIVGDYKIYKPWSDFTDIKQESNLSLLSSIYQNHPTENGIIIKDQSNQITAFGYVQLSKLLVWDFAKIIRYYPLLAHLHLEIASTVSQDGIERLWIRHCGFNETWKISENVRIWEPIARDAWTPVLNGNILVLGRAVAISDPYGNPKNIKMVVVPGSLLLRVV